MFLYKGWCVLYSIMYVIVLEDGLVRNMWFVNMWFVMEWVVFLYCMVEVRGICEWIRIINIVVMISLGNIIFDKKRRIYMGNFELI